MTRSKPVGAPLSAGKLLAIDESGASSGSVVLILRDFPSDDDDESGGERFSSHSWRATPSGRKLTLEKRKN